MANRFQIINFLQEKGLPFVEKNRTIVGVPCPLCGREDKFSILKANGHTICYRSSCDYGKRSFVGFIQSVTGGTFEEAIAVLKSEKNEYQGILGNGLQIDLDIKDHFDGLHSEGTSFLNDLKPIKYPEWHMTPIGAPEAKDGLDYLESRGVTLDVAQELDITYSSFYQRVYFPIKMNGSYYGYQGRAVKKVSDKDRIRNNEGFSRDSLVMFADNLIENKDAIIAEGPFDGIKFHKVGGYVVTMGKEITEKQIKVIMSYKPEKIFLALDDDAAYEMNQLMEKISLPVYKIDVPKSCVKRCEQMGKKADFGECTFEEAEQAKLNARPLTKQSLLVYIK
jgi:Zn ribbon nucleic-acid-binding protein